MENLNNFSKILVPANQYDLASDQRYLIPYIQGNKIGFIDNTGNVKIKPFCDFIVDDFIDKSSIIRVGEYYVQRYLDKENQSKSYINKRYGLLKSDGNFIVRMIYEGIKAPIGSSAYTIRSFNDGYAVIDKDGRFIVPFGKYSYIDGFDSGFAAVKVNGTNNGTHDGSGKWGIINDNGEEVLLADKDDVTSFYDKNMNFTNYIYKGREYKFTFNDNATVIKRSLSQKEKEIESAYKELEEIWNKELQESIADTNETLEMNPYLLDWEDNINVDEPEKDIIDKKQIPKPDDSKISTIIMENQKTIEEKSKFIYSKEGKFGIYDVRFFRKGGFRVYKDYSMLFQKEFLIRDIDKIIYDKTHEIVTIKFNTHQIIDISTGYSLDEITFYVKYSRLYLECFLNGEKVNQFKCDFDKTGCGLRHLFDGFCSLTQLKEGNVVMMVSGNAYVVKTLQFFYNEHLTKDFKLLSEEEWMFF